MLRLNEKTKEEEYIKYLDSILIESNLFENPNKNNMNILQKIFKKKKEKESEIEEKKIIPNQPLS